MVENPYVDEPQRITEFIGERSIGSTGLRQATGMVVLKDRRARVDIAVLKQFIGNDPDHIPNAADIAEALKERLKRGSPVEPIHSA